jgi:hypothetical protein
MYKTNIGINLLFIKFNCVTCIPSTMQCSNLIIELQCKHRIYVFIVRFHGLKIRVYRNGIPNIVTKILIKLFFGYVSWSFLFGYKSFQQWLCEQFHYIGLKFSNHLWFDNASTKAMWNTSLPSYRVFHFAIFFTMLNM